MKFSTATVRVLVVAIVIACIGLIGLQVRLLLNTADLKRTTFEQNAIAALRAAADALESHAVMDNVFRVQLDSSTAHRRSMVFVGSDAVRPPRTMSIFKARPVSGKRVAVSVLMTDLGSIQTTVRGNTIVTRLDRPQRITVEAYDQLGRLDTTLLKDVRVAGEQRLQLTPKRFDRGTFYIRVRTDKEVSTIRVDSAGSSNGFSFSAADSGRRENVVRRVVESMADPARMMIARFVAPKVLDSLVHDALRQRGLDVPFQAALRVDGSTVCRSDTTFMWPTSTKELEVPVGVAVPFGPRESLAAVFPTMGRYLIGQMWLDIGLSIVLIGLIVWMFWVTVRTLVRQREFAARLTDFINNMTHEFKTPIATIALAGEALEKPEVRRSAKKLSAYTGVIRDENKRMGSQVERILHMASLEEGDVVFRKDRLSMHEIIRRSEERFRVHVESRGGAIALDLRAENDAIIGDRDHIENVVHNLLDNAFKYSPERPAITITTESSPTTITVSVKDSGVGIAHHDLERVFEKYYRVPTGNVHDVKGFGLGLSYVRLVVEQHGGTVSLTSEPGSGTEVTVRLPLAGGAS